MPTLAAIAATAAPLVVGAISALVLVRAARLARGHGFVRAVLWTLVIACLPVLYVGTLLIDLLLHDYMRRDSATALSPLACRPVPADTAPDFPMAHLRHIPLGAHRRVEICGNGEAFI